MVNPLEVHYKNSFAALKIGHYLTEYAGRNTAIVCIGTDKCIVDSLGPIIGTMLIRENIDVDVFGTLKEPVHAVNLDDWVRLVNSRDYETVIAVDACLSARKGQGIVEVRHSPVTPGKGIGKRLPEIGDISVVGIVESADKEFYSLVQETRLSLIFDMAEVITAGISNAVRMNRMMESGACVPTF